jgi:hypothetical protein
MQLPGVQRAVSFCVKNLGWIVEDEGAERDLHEWVVLRAGSHEALSRDIAEFVEF